MLGLNKYIPEFEMLNNQQPDIIYIEACNFIDKPLGGQLSYSKQLIKALGTRLALVGWASSPSDPVGCWFTKEINGMDFRYFAIARTPDAAIKPIVPARLSTWLLIRRYQKLIFSIGIPNVLISEHSVLMSLQPRRTHNICFCFPGVDSPLSISRYPWAKQLSTLFDHFFFHALGKKANCILAAADESAIVDVQRRAGEKLKGKAIFSFPTRVDTNTFYPRDRLHARRQLDLPTDKIIVVTSGRIHWAKGWEFLLQAYQLFLKRCPNSMLFFLGDGSDRKYLEEKVEVLGLRGRVVVAGMKSSSEVATYIQASNMFVMGSYKEGWSTSMLEALACQVPIVTTRFSSADSIVCQGVNGFVVDRDPHMFSIAMENVLSLCTVAAYSNETIGRYALTNLSKDLLNVWSLHEQAS